MLHALVGYFGCELFVVVADVCVLLFDWWVLNVLLFALDNSVDCNDLLRLFLWFIIAVYLLFVTWRLFVWCLSLLCCLGWLYGGYCVYCYFGFFVLFWLCWIVWYLWPWGCYFVDFVLCFVGCCLVIYWLCLAVFWYWIGCFAVVYGYWCLLFSSVVGRLFVYNLMFVNSVDCVVLYNSDLV